MSKQVDKRSRKPPERFDPTPKRRGVLSEKEKTQRRLTKAVHQSDAEGVQNALAAGADPQATPISPFVLLAQYNTHTRHLAMRESWSLDLIQRALLIDDFAIIQLLLENLANRNIECTGHCKIAKYFNFAIYVRHPSIRNAYIDRIGDKIALACNPSQRIGLCKCWDCTSRRIPVFDKCSKNAQVMQLLFDSCRCTEACHLIRWKIDALVHTNDLYIAKMLVNRYSPFVGEADVLAQLLFVNRSEMLKLFFLNYDANHSFLPFRIVHYLTGASSNDGVTSVCRDNGQNIVCTVREYFCDNVEGIHNWAPAKHHLFSPAVKRAVETCLLLRDHGHRLEYQNPWRLLPNELLFIIFTYAFPPPRLYVNHGAFCLAHKQCD